MAYGTTGGLAACHAFDMYLQLIPTASHISAVHTAVLAAWHLALVALLLPKEDQLGHA